MRKVSGFTIIELVVVITILGILAAVALPKFFDIQNDARAASAAGVAGAVASASAINYGSRVARGSFVPGTHFTVAACTIAALGPLLSGNVLPTGISVGDAGFAASATSTGLAGPCVFVHNGGGAATTVTVIAVLN